mmetsp:Transcript_81307/g.148682  ORF Transcript_81307/g.148682 Transcript_81307/m.148682 type:complete len:137 (+) Transcript_81307:2-412(+)
MPVFSPPRLCTPRPPNGSAPLLSTPVRDAILSTPTPESGGPRSGDEGLNGTSNAAAPQASCGGGSLTAGALASKELDASCHSIGSLGALSETGPGGSAATDDELLDSKGSSHTLPRDVPEILRQHLEAVTVEQQCK